jgi:hypothetical protein
VIDAFALCQANRTNEYVRLQPTIGIREQNPLASRCVSAEVTGVAFAEPTVRKRCDVNHLEARIFFRELFEDFTGAIGGPVINDDQFHFNMRLREQAADGVFDARLLIASCHNNRTADV